MNHYINLNLLKKINKVNTPTFLYSSIKEKIENKTIGVPTLQWKSIYTIAAMFVVMINIFFIFKINENITNDNDSEGIVKSMNLINKNNLYNE